jgi:hypothetical protein
MSVLVSGVRSFAGAPTGTHDSHSNGLGTGRTGRHDGRTVPVHPPRRRGMYGLLWNTIHDYSSCPAGHNILRHSRSPEHSPLHSQTRSVPTDHQERPCWTSAVAACIPRSSTRGRQRSRRATPRSWTMDCTVSGEGSVTWMLLSKIRRSVLAERAAYPVRHEHAGVRGHGCPRR